MAAQPTNSSQNTGLVVLCVGIFMVIMAFLAVNYLSSDTIRENQDKNRQRSSTERSNLTQITCALWASIGEPEKVDPAVAKKVQDLCP